jgi:glutamate N-acetyltransferase/amino-acid N-acetyltransferase
MGLAGFQAGGVAANIKKNGALDLALIVSDTECAAAGVFTTNRVKAAPVLVNLEKLAKTGGKVRAIVVNSGCANACTGRQGIDNANATARHAAAAIGCHEDEVLVMSTGVIGVQLPLDKVTHGIDLAMQAANAENWDAAARAIMTTDTRPKQAASSGDGYTIAGIAKGAGMIAPNMATMLSFIHTDARLSPGDVRTALRHAAEMTFNRIVVDGDMSTNDTVLLLANGCSGTAVETSDELARFTERLTEVCRTLAHAIVRDGEGVTKFVGITVEGVASDADARTIANTIATSPLVKTAFYGNDANWGRIVAAAGRAGVDFDGDSVDLSVAPGVDENAGDPLVLVKSGTPTDYSEDAASAIVRGAEFSYTLTVGTGDGRATVWTCDFSHEYVSINAEYRT